jgi:hypothetical protein
MARTDHDKARIRRECQEILAELPLDATEAEAQEALRPTVREASRQIKQREAEKDRQSRKQGLVQNGVYKLSSYLWKLKNEGEITVDDYLDSEFEAALAQAVRRGLNAELNGDETTKEVDELVREIVDLELE